MDNPDIPHRGPLNTRQIRADDLRYLLALARTGRRAAVAADMGVDGATVTRRLRALEKSLGVRLIVHGSDGWELTNIGKSVASAAEPIDTAIDHAADIVLGTGQESLRGTVRVTAPDAFGAHFVAPALAQLGINHPQLTIELITATRQLNLHQSGFDVAIAVGSPVSTRLVSETLTPYSLSLYATEDYLEHYGTPADVKELKNHTLIWFVDSLLQVGDLDLAEHLPGMHAQFMSTNVWAHVEATCAGVGIGLLPYFLARRHTELIRVLGEQVDIRIDYSLAARRENLTSPAVQEVRRAIHAEVLKRTAELLPPVG